MHCPTHLSKTKLFASLAAITLLVGSLAVVTFSVGSVLAQEETLTSGNQTTLTAIPPRLGDDGTLTADPGETIQTTIRVRNASDQSVNILTQAQDFIVDEDGTTPIPIIDANVSNRWSLASWMTIAPSAQTLEPSETASISVAIQVPEDALPGGHYAMILHQPSTETVENLLSGAEASSESVAGISQQVGTLVYLVVSGPINEEVYVRNFVIPGFSEYGPVPFSYSIENRSDVHISPSMMMRITDFLGREVANFPVTGANIFPLTQRDFEGAWEQIWGYGRYTATLTASYGSSGRLAVATQQFWLFPITLVVGIIMSILILIAVIIVIRRHMIHRKTDQSARIKELEDQLSQMNDKQE